MLYERETTGTIDEVSEKVQQAVAENAFGVLGIHDLKQKLNDKGVDFERECRVMEVCNPVKAKAVLESNMSISNALPCRISIYQDGDSIKVSTLRPTRLMGLFNQPELEPVAEEVEQTLIRIIDSAVQ